jgi:hypothetical protein
VLDEQHRHPQSAAPAPSPIAVTMEEQSTIRQGEGTRLVTVL